MTPLLNDAIHDLRLRWSILDVHEKRIFFGAVMATLRLVRDNHIAKQLYEQLDKNGLEEDLS